jgi:XTP/dITP diphosphohydrolase
MELYFVTTNPGKVESLQRDLGKYGISVVQEPRDLIEPRSSDVQEIAQAKITEAYAKIHQPTIVVDAGFYIHSLNGFPRAFVNFALDTIDLEGILNLVVNKPRECEFRECLAYMDATLSEPIYLLSHVKGKLAYEPQGVMQKHLWSRLGLIFIPDGSSKTLASMTLDEYTQWRAHSREKESLGQKLYAWLKENNKVQ